MLVCLDPKLRNNNEKYNVPDPGRFVFGKCLSTILFLGFSYCFICYHIRNDQHSSPINNIKERAYITYFLFLPFVEMYAGIYKRRLPTTN